MPDARACRQGRETERCAELGPYMAAGRVSSAGTSVSVLSLDQISSGNDAMIICSMKTCSFC